MRNQRMHRRFAVLLIALAAATTAAACGGRTPADSAERIKAGDALIAQKKPAEAINEYRLAVQADNKNALARRRLGEAFALLGDLTRAAEQLARAADLSPNDAALQLEAARALLAIGSFEDARTR